MSIAQPIFLVLALDITAAAQAQNGKPLFIAADMVRGPGEASPICVLTSRFMRKEIVAWRIRVQDAGGKQLDNKSLRSVVVESFDGQKFDTHYGGHLPNAPTDHL